MLVFGHLTGYFGLLFQITICLGQLSLVLSQFLFDVGKVSFNLFLVEVVLLTVLSPEFGTVSRHEFTADQFKMPGRLYGGSEHLLYSLGIVSAKIRNGIMVGYQSFEQPNELNVAPAFLL
jgi:hypothetical protein